jgi:hypothetical protein
MDSGFSNCGLVINQERHRDPILNDVGVQTQGGRSRADRHGGLEALRIFTILLLSSNEPTHSLCFQQTSRMSAERPSTPPRQNAAGPGQLPREPLTPEQKRKIVRHICRTST